MLKGLKLCSNLYHSPPILLVFPQCRNSFEQCNYKVYNLYYISLRKVGGGMTLLTDTDNLYLIFMLLKYNLTHTIYQQADN